MSDIHGIVAYPVTPFDEDDSPDLATLRRLVDRLVETGADAIAPLGSTGESAYLGNDEWNRVAETAVHATAGQVPSVVGISDLTTAGAVRRAIAAAQYGAQAVMVLPVSYWPLTERELTEHFAAVADATDLQVMIYNNPATAGIDMRPEFLVDLVERFDTITMIKESSGDITRMHRIVELGGGRIPFFNGSNPLAQPALEAGAAGWCTAAPCVIPGAVRRFYDAATTGDQATAGEVFAAMLPFLQSIVRLGLPTAIKAVLRHDGFDAGVPRRPLLELEDATLKELLDQFAAAR